MHAKDLIGKRALRFIPAKTDKSYMTGYGVLITNVTETHVYIQTEDNERAYALDSDYLYGWTEFDPYPPIPKEEEKSEQREWTADCPKCGSLDLELIPGSIVLASYPAIYHVRCKKCGTETRSRKCNDSYPCSINISG